MKFRVGKHEREKREYSLVFAHESYLISIENLEKQHQFWIEDYDAKADLFRGVLPIQRQLGRNLAHNGKI